MKKTLITLLITLLLSTSSVAKSSDVKVTDFPPFGMHNSQPVIPVPTKTQNLNVGKCSVEGQKQIDALHEAGYHGMVQFNDKDTHIVRILMYDASSEHMAIVSIIRDKTEEEIDAINKTTFDTELAKAKEESRPPQQVDRFKPNIVKVCVEYVGDHPYGSGTVFKDFILHQNILDQNYVNDMNEEVKKTGGEEHGPYQGDPGKV